MFDQENMTEEEKRDEIWHYLEKAPEIMDQLTHDRSPYIWDLDQEYFPVQLQYRERGFSGFENDPINREVIVALEHLIENIVGAQRIQEKKMMMLKGTPKKWQILDDDAFDRDQIEKLQAAARAPLPDELEMF